MASPNQDPPRASNGLLKVFLGVGVLAMLGTCTALLSPPGRELIRTTTSFVTTVGQAANAQGTSELRELGCDQALVMTVDELMGPMAEIADVFEGGDFFDEAITISGDTVWIQCRVSLPAFAIPSCESIAETYGAATNAPAAFIVVSGKPGERICSGYYAPDGARLGGLGKGDLSLVPQ